MSDAPPSFLPRYVDCALNPAHCGGTGGCAGSIPELAFNYTAAHGLPLEADLPYQGLDGVCKRYEPAVFCDGYRKLPQNDAAAVESAIAMEGPVRDATTTTWAGEKKTGCT
jgi:hypothetical protein